MNKKVFNIIGWILLLGMGASWIGFGYSSWDLLFLPLTYICFSIYNGRIKRLEIIKQMTISQVILILFAFIVSVGIAFGLFQLANYLINNLLHLKGWIKTFSQFIAVILSLYPVKFTFWSIVYKVIDDLNGKRIV